MDKATISRLKNNLSAYLAYVRRGGRVVIFNRDTPVAEIVPIETRHAETPAVDRHLDRLERQGLITRGTGSVPEDLLVAPQGVPTGALEELLRERAKGR